MIQATIKGRAVNIPQGWQDVTLETYIDYLKDVEPKAPAKMQELWAAKGKKRQAVLESISQKEYALEFIPFFAQYVAFWLELEVSFVMQIDKDEMETLYFQIEKNLARSYEELDKEQRTIEHNGTTWHLPEKFMRGSTVIEFIEAAQFEHNASQFIGGQFTALPDIMCVLLRKDGEAYNMEMTSRRAMWLKMTMDKAFVVAFFLLRQSKKFANDLLFYTMLKQTLSQSKQELTN